MTYKTFINDPIPANLKGAWLFVMLLVTFFSNQNLLHLLIVFIPLSWLLFTFRKGAIVDTGFPKYKIFLGPAPLYFGKWNVIDEPEFLEVEAFSKTSGSFQIGGDTSSAELYYGVYLAERNKEDMKLIYRHQSEEKARGFAQELAAKLDVEVR